MSARGAAPGTGIPGQRQDRTRNEDSFTGRARLRKMFCARCRRRFQPISERTKYCGACAAKALARAEFFKALRLAGVLK